MSNDGNNDIKIPTKLVQEVKQQVSIVKDRNKVDFPNGIILISYLILMIGVIGGIFLNIYLGVSNLGWFNLSLKQNVSPISNISSGMWIFISWCILVISLIPALTYLVIGFKSKNEWSNNIIISLLIVIFSGGANLPIFILELILKNKIYDIALFFKKIAMPLLIIGLIFALYNLFVSGFLITFFNLEDKEISSNIIFSFLSSFIAENDLNKFCPKETPNCLSEGISNGQEGYNKVSEGVENQTSILTDISKSLEPYIKQVIEVYKTAKETLGGLGDILG